MTFTISNARCLCSPDMRGIVWLGRGWALSVAATFFAGFNNFRPPDSVSCRFGGDFGFSCFFFRLRGGLTKLGQA